MADRDWATIPDAELVELAGEAGFRGVPGGIRQPSPDGFIAQAELSRRLAEEFRQQRAASDRAAEQLARYTRWLIVLTVVLVVLGLATLVVAA
jgi:hypothetical protein